MPKASPAQGAAPLQKVNHLKTVTGTSLALAPDIDPEYVASQLVPATGGSASDKARAFAAMLETPFVSAREMANAGTLFTILDAAYGEVEAIGDAGRMVPQTIFMIALQGDIQYTNSKGDLREYGQGDVVLLAQGRNKVRDQWFDIAKEAKANGERLPNFQAYERPSKTAGFSPAVAFRQLEG